MLEVVGWKAFLDVVLNIAEGHVETEYCERCGSKIGGGHEPK